ncbi:MAG: hypothetical protein ABIF40_03440, partial [archaeon]
LTAVEDDKSLLKTYANIIFSEKPKNKLMCFWVRQNIEEDELRALFVDNLSNYSNANGSSSLYNFARFLRLSQA